ncbi:hypothetical protein pdam_00001489, partial [Pocillopora damicornis]
QSLPFVQEVGDRYAPRSLYGIVCGLKRHLKDKNGGKALNPLDRSYKSLPFFDVWTPKCRMLRAKVFILKPRGR